MAKKTEIIEEAAVVEEPKKAKKLTEADPEYYEEKVSIFIPIEEGGSDELVVGHNGTIYKIQKGTEVEVPRKLAIIIKNSNAQAVAMKKYSESVKNQELNA